MAPSHGRATSRRCALTRAPPRLRATPPPSLPHRSAGKTFGDQLVRYEPELRTFLTTHSAFCASPLSACFVASSVFCLELDFDFHYTGRLCGATEQYEWKGELNALQASLVGEYPSTTFSLFNVVPLLSAKYDEFPGHSSPMLALWMCVDATAKHHALAHTPTLSHTVTHCHVLRTSVRRPSSSPRTQKPTHRVVPTDPPVCVVRASTQVVGAPQRPS